MLLIRKRIPTVFRREASALRGNSAEMLRGISLAVTEASSFFSRSAGGRKSA
jgi:hypothetical protein